uniref:Uncharacterized protein n=1 Tax=Amphimedon queenslandica TaxID=400682 RepID=A0A1X7UYC2_AMPQE
KEMELMNQVLIMTQHIMTMNKVLKIAEQNHMTLTQRKDTNYCIKDCDNNKLGQVTNYCLYSVNEAFWLLE